MFKPFTCQSNLSVRAFRLGSGFLWPPQALFTGGMPTLQGSACDFRIPEVGLGILFMCFQSSLSLSSSSNSSHSMLISCSPPCPARPVHFLKTRQGDGLPYYLHSPHYSVHCRYLNICWMNASSMSIKWILYCTISEIIWLQHKLNYIDLEL